MRRAGLVMMMLAGWPAVALAEDAWIRVEAKRGDAVEAALSEWRARYPDVVSFALPNGMTGIALGPQAVADAAARMARLKAAGEIPGDSYLTAPGGLAPLAGAALGAAAAAALPAATDAGRPASGDAPTTPVAAAQAAGTHIQLQATPGRVSADETLARWRETFPEAGLWRLPGGMFAVALAAQDPDAAAASMAALKRQNRIPQDAYLAETAALGQVMSPSVAAGEDPAPAAPQDSAQPTTSAEPTAGQEGRTTAMPLEPSTANPAEPSTAGISDGDAEAPDGAAEGVTDPRNDPQPTAGAGSASTAAVGPDDVPAPPAPPAVMPPIAEVQAALRWAGHYDGPIDDKSGPGTKSAIDAEIAANAEGQPPAEAMVALLARRAAWRADMGLTRLEDPATGLSLSAPLNRLAFDRVERGLSIYGPKDGSGAALILSRMPGGQQEMLDFAGLVTALGWVPNPQRTVARGSVTLDGTDDTHRGHAEARVTDDGFEGFVLIWPAADADNARRLAAEMGETLSRTESGPAADDAGEALDGPVAD